MSQDASTYSTTLDSFEVESSGSSSLVDSYADSLMNELFEDVETLLEGGFEPPSEPLHADPEPRTLTVPYVTLPPAVISAPISALKTIPSPSEDALDVFQSETEQARRRGRRLDYLLLGAACATFLLTAGVWWTNRGNFFTTSTVTDAPPVLTPEELKAQADAEFMEYLQRSLEVIDRKAETQSPVASAAPVGTPAAGNLPRVAVAGGQGPGSPVPPPAGQLPPAPGQPPNVNVIERIYVPLYQPQAGVPSTPFQNFALRYAAPQQAPTAVTPSQPTVPLPAAPVAAAPTAPASPVAPAAVHTLVGVLELGDRSAALFEINGSTQRFFVGEPIASSGWTLVSVVNQEAVIRRNGEVRSVYVGQKF